MAVIQPDGCGPNDAFYLCPQSLFKLHPDFDELIASLLRADSRGNLALLEADQPAWTEKIRRRLALSCRDVLPRIHFLPRMARDDFLAALNSADVILDPLHFSGGNTTFEALAMGTPVVTWPGPFMRSRVTYACLRQLGIDAGIACSRDDYLARALRLGTDLSWRRDVRARIESASPALFADRQTLHDFEEHVAAAVAQSR